jgi:TetR/AcrR family acrAB operon transcriptional repressor
MARRTKEEAQATRARLLDCAETLFQAQGVSRTSLQRHRAGRRRHARRGVLAFQGQGRPVQRHDGARDAAHGVRPAQRPAHLRSDPLAHVRGSVLNALGLIANDSQTRRVFDVITHKVEYISELNAVRDRHLAARGRCLDRMAGDLRAAARLRGQRLPVPATTAAQACTR